MKTEIVTIGRSSLTGPEASDALARAGQILREGGLVAFPTETVYGLGGNALDPEASRKIYAAKGRPSDNPLIVHIQEPEEIEPLVTHVPDMAHRLMEAFWPGPMTLVLEKSRIVPEATTGGLSTVAVRLPSDEIARALIRAAGVPVAAPSANASGRPSPTLAEHVARDLDGRIEMILDGGEVKIGLESTIIDVTGPSPVILRPGYITREMVEDVCGEASFDPAILSKPSADLRPKAPGMKYRHYAPQAELTLYRGEPQAVRETISGLVREALAQGKRVGVLCAGEDKEAFEALGPEAAAQPDGNVRTETVREPEAASLTEAEAAAAKPLQVVAPGPRADDRIVARHLFRALRSFDRLQVDVIYGETFEDGPLADAIMNRLKKAAGYRIVDL